MTRREIEETFFSTLDEKNLDLTKAIAEIIKYNPEALETKNMTELAKSLGVDEIHVIDKNGVLLQGNVEGFFGFDFNTSEQTLPFIDLIGKNNGRSAQAPSQRGTDEVLFQYIGVSRLDEPGIVQIGLEPQYIEKLRGIIGLQRLIEGIQVGKSGYAYVVDSDGITLFHQNPENIGLDINEIPVLSPLLENENGFFNYVFQDKKIYAAFRQLEDWTIVATVPEDDFLPAVQGIMKSIFIFFGITLGLVALCIIFIASRLFKPIHTMAEKMEIAGNGDLGVRMDHRSKDELGILHPVSIKCFLTFRNYSMTHI